MDGLQEFTHFPDPLHVVSQFGGSLPLGEQVMHIHRFPVVASSLLWYGVLGVSIFSSISISRTIKLDLNFDLSSDGGIRNIDLNSDGGIPGLNILAWLRRGIFSEYNSIYRLKIPSFAAGFEWGGDPYGVQYALNFGRAGGRVIRAKFQLRMVTDSQFLGLEELSLHLDMRLWCGAPSLHPGYHGGWFPRNLVVFQRLLRLLRLSGRRRFGSGHSY